MFPLCLIVFHLHQHFNANRDWARLECNKTDSLPKSKAPSFLFYVRSGDSHFHGAHIITQRNKSDERKEREIDRERESDRMTRERMLWTWSDSTICLPWNKTLYFRSKDMRQRINKETERYREIYIKIHNINYSLENGAERQKERKRQREREWGSGGRTTIILFMRTIIRKIKWTENERQARAFVCCYEMFFSFFSILFLLSFLSCGRLT